MIDETSTPGQGTATGGSAGMGSTGTGGADKNKSGTGTDPGLTGRIDAGQIGENARQAGETVKQHATGLAHTLMDEAGKQVERQRERLADRVVGVADIVRDTGQRLAEREPWIGRYVEQSAQGLTTLADQMRDRDPRELIGQVTDFARHQPALFTGAAVAVGFVVARMTRGSIEGAGGARYERRRSGGWQERGDYERASWQERDWQDRDWQGASPGHAHDDEHDDERGRYGFTDGSSGSRGRSDPSRYGSPAGGGLGSTGSSSTRLGDQRPSAGHSGPGSSHGQVSAVSGASGSVGASGSSVPGATAAAARERTYEDAKEAGEDGDETRIRNPEATTPFEPAVKAGGTASGSRTSPATGETPR